jgi:hypothetical protein
VLVLAVIAESLAVIRHRDDERVVRAARPIEQLEEPAELLVHERRLAVVRRDAGELRSRPPTAATAARPLRSRALDAMAISNLPRTRF